MMNILTSEMVSRVTLDTSHAQGALRDLQRESTATTREWKSMSSQLSAAGDQAGAASARMNGLGNTIANQKQKIEILQQGLQGVNRETKAGTSLYNYLQKELEKAERQLGSYDGQLKRASETDRYYQSGLASLTQKLQRNTDIMHIREQRLQAQGREEAAAKTHVDGLKNSQESLSGILKIQERELNRVASQSGKTSEEYHKQAMRVEETKKSLAETRAELKYYQSGLAGGEQKLKELNTALTHNNELYKANADRLELQGRHNASLQTKLAGTKNAYATQNKELSEQREQLKRLESAQDRSNESLAKQRAEVAKSEAKLAGYGKEIKTVQREVDHLNPFGFSKMGQGMNALYQTSNKTFDSMHRGFQSVRNGAMNAALGIGVVGAASIKGAQMASELENQYKTTFNLLVTGGEKAAEAQKNVNKMQSEGKRMSVEYGVAQSKIADGYQELVKRGYSSEQALGSMKTMLQGARASGDDFTDVVHNSTAALESFGKKTDSVTGMAKNTKVVVNQMAFAADATATDFKSMGIAMEYTGATAHQSGLSLSETASAIGVLSNNGLEADKAGTGLRKAISSLQSPTKNATEALNGIGLSTKDFVDKSGKMKSMTEIFGMLNQHTEKLSKFQKGQLFHALFGATGEQAGAILSSNAKDLGELNKKVEESAKGQGYVADLAKKNMGSVKNELAQFKEAGNAALIMIGKEMLPVLREASVQLVKTFDSKEGQKGLRTLAHGVGFLAKSTADFVGFLGSHTHEVEAFGAVLGAMWGLKKVGQFIILVKDAKTALLELKAVSTAMDFIGGGSIGKIGKVAKGIQVATTATKGASSIGAATAGASEAEAVTSVAAKAAPALGKVLLRATATGVGGGVISGLMEATSKKPIHEKVGGTIGAGIGTGIGAFFGGPGGAMLGGTIGQKAGELWGNEVQKSLNKKPITPKISLHSQNSNMKRLEKQYNSFIGNLSKNTQLNPTISTKDLKSQENSVLNSYKRMESAINKFYQNKEAQSRKDLQVLVKNGAMSQKEADKYYERSKKNDTKEQKAKKDLLNGMKKDTTNYYAQLQKIHSGQDKKLQDIEKKYGRSSKRYKDEQRKLEQKANKNYQDRLVKDNDKFQKNINKTVRSANTKQLDILHDLQKKKGKISQAEMKDAISKSNKQKNVLIKDANETYRKSTDSAKKKRDETIRAADKEYYENGSISKKQHDDIVGKADDQYKNAVSSANKQKKESIDHATEQHNKVVDQATKQAHEHKDAVDDETGNVLDVWSQMSSGLADVVNGITGGINGLLKVIDKDHPLQIPKWTPGNYVSAKKRNRAYGAHALGHQGLTSDEIALVGEEGFELAHHPQKGLFALGVNGPEVRPLDAGTSILPHDLSKQFMAMTQGLPAHKDGVGGFIGDAFNFAKGMFKDVESVLDKGPKKALDMIEDKVGVKSFINSFSQAGSGLLGFARGGVSTVTDTLLKRIKGIFDKAQQEINAKDIGAGGNWRSQIEKAAKEAHVTLGSGDMQAIMARINKESGGRQNIKQQIYDINTANGNPAQGLLQYIPPTFRSWAVSGHTNILSGYDQLMAMFNDSNWASDIRMPGGWGPTGHRRLENGGLTTKHQMVEISENNQPEITIPMAKVKGSRGYELLGQAVTMFAARDQMGMSNASSDAAVNALNDKFDKMLNYLSSIAENTGKESVSRTYVDRNELWQKQSSDKQLFERQNLNFT